MNSSLEAQWDLPADPQAVGKGRDMVRDTLDSWALSDLLAIDDVVLAISELCTNAMIHGSAPITLRLCVTGRCLVGEVVDQGAVFEVPRPRVSPDDQLDQDDEDEHGRGLNIVAALVGSWGVKALPGGGKAVRFRCCW